MKRVMITGALLLFLSGLSHGIWMEIQPTGKVDKPATVFLYFGELNNHLREKGLKWYGGDMFSDFKATIKNPLNKKSELPLKATAYSLSGKFTPKHTGIYQIIAVNETAPVRDVTKHGLGILKDYTYLRTIFEATHYKKQQEKSPDVSPMMAYDIVPFPAKSGYGNYVAHTSLFRKHEKVYACFYINQEKAPLKEIKIIAPNGWYKIKKTNQEGIFSFTPNASGFYQLVYEKKEKIAGTYKGKKFDTQRIKSITVIKVR